MITEVPMATTLDGLLAQITGIPGFKLPTSVDACKKMGEAMVAHFMKPKPEKKEVPTHEYSHGLCSYGLWRV